VVFGAGVFPSPVGKGLERALSPAQKNFDFRAQIQNGEIWCILGAIFYYSAAC